MQHQGQIWRYVPRVAPKSHYIAHRRHFVTKMSHPGWITTKGSVSLEVFKKVTVVGLMLSLHGQDAKTNNILHKVLVGISGKIIWEGGGGVGAGVFSSAAVASEGLCLGPLG